MSKETFINAWGVPEEVQPEDFTHSLRTKLRKEHPEAQLQPLGEPQKYTLCGLQGELDGEIPISKYAAAECAQVVKEAAAMRKRQ